MKRPQILANQLPQSSIAPQSVSAKAIQITNNDEIMATSKPMDVSPYLYAIDSTARVLELIEEPRNIGKNSITPDILASFIEHETRPYLIIDCRFDYEYNGGHIKNAINITDP